MRRYLLCILALATVVFSASTCEKMEPGDYHDYLGNKINLLGAWALTEVGSGLTTKSSMDELYSTNTLIIMYDVEVGKDPLLAAVKELGAEILYDYNIIPGMAVRIPDGSDIQKAIVYFKQVKGVVSVERDQIHLLTDPVRPRIETM